MDPKTLLFVLFALVTIGAALLVITARNPVHAALWLVLTFFSTACIWMLLKAEFLAITLVLVYVGAVMVLFLFVVMMLDIDLSKIRVGFWKHLTVAGIVGSTVAIELFAVVLHGFNTVKAVDAPAVPAGYSNTKVLGNLIYTEYVYPFEIAAVLLLVAIVAAIALTLRKRKDSRYNDPSVSVKTRSVDRLRIVKIASQPRVSNVTPKPVVVAAAPATAPTVAAAAPAAVAPNPSGAKPT
jgi:NADH-quinone oxidoreductase subunit J